LKAYYFFNMRKSFAVFWCFLFGLLIIPQHCLAAVYINEVMPNPEDNIERVELYNDGVEPVDLTGWRLEDAAGKSHDLAPLDLIEASDFVVFEYDCSTTGWLNNSGGDSVFLFQPDQSDPVSQVTYPSKEIGINEIPDKGESFGWCPDLGVWQIFTKPSFGTSNNCLRPTATATPMPATSPTSTPTLTSTPVPETSSSDIYINASFENEVDTGEEFQVNFNVEHAKVGEEYRIKVRIGKTISSLTDGQTFSNDHGWLNDTAGWTKFPKFSPDGFGNYSGQVKARVKPGLEGGDYRLVVRVKLADETHSDSADYPLNVTAVFMPTPTPTDKPTNTPTPSPSLTPTASPTPKQSSPSATLAPSVAPLPRTEEKGSFDLTDNQGKVLGQKLDNQAELVSDKVGSSSKFIAGGLVVLGGGLVGSTFVLSKLNPKSGRIKKHEKKKTKAKVKQASD